MLNVASVIVASTDVERKNILTTLVGVSFSLVTCKEEEIVSFLTFLKKKTLSVTLQV